MAFECKALSRDSILGSNCLGVVWDYLWSGFGVIRSLCVHLHLPGSGVVHGPVTLIERE